MKEKSKKLINTVITFLKDFFTQKHQQHLRTQQNYQQQMIINRILQVQNQVQQELFVALHGNHYTNVQPLSAPKNIRIHDWLLRNGTTIFRYTLSVTAMPAQTLLDLTRNNMNTDIYQCQQDLLTTHPALDVEMLYPCIFYGLYVIDIHPIGNDICISVVTNYI